MGTHTSKARQRAVSTVKEGGPTAEADTQAEADSQIRLIPLPVVYNQMRAIPVREGSATAQTSKIADAVFSEKIITAKGFGGYKLAGKRAFFRDFFQACLLAIYYDGCVRYSHKPGRHGCTKGNLKVLEAMVAAGLLRDIKSPPGSPKMSRYIPFSTLRKYACRDPWEIDAQPLTPQYVFLRRRSDKVEIPFDREHPTAKDVQQKLEVVNEVNSGHRFTYIQHDTWDVGRSTTERTRQLRPVHSALFTENFEHHGRLYTGLYGHQSLRKSERKTIRIDGESSVEVDFCGLHCRMLYHLKSINYRRDPYALWGKATTGPLRLMAKLLINAAINAASKDKAIAACNFNLSLYTGEKDEEGRKIRKQGAELEDAFRMQSAADGTGLAFSQIFALALQRHRRIEHYFGSDMGIKLMRHDSAIALDILHHFALRCIPCLAVHDSFIVPKRYDADLRQTMMQCYKRQLGFLPVLNT